MTLRVNDRVRHDFHGIGVIKDFINKETVEVHFGKKILNLSLKNLKSVAQEEQDKKRNDFLDALEEIFNYRNDEIFMEKVDRYYQSSGSISAEEYKNILESLEKDWLKRADKFFSSSCNNCISEEEYVQRRTSFLNKLKEDVRELEKEELLLEKEKLDELREQEERKELIRKVEQKIHKSGKCCLCGWLSPKSKLNIVGESSGVIYITCKKCEEFLENFFPNITANEIEQALKISKSEKIVFVYALNYVRGTYSLSEAIKRSRDPVGGDIWDGWRRQPGCFGTH